jgi:hypothetical protein
MADWSFFGLSPGHAALGSMERSADARPLLDTSGGFVFLTSADNRK